MKAFYIIYVFALFLSVLVMMAMMLAWNKEVDPLKKKKWRKAWHGFSWIFRLAGYILLLITLWGDWTTIGLLTPMAITFCWMIWDGVINLHLNEDWWYVGFTSDWDKLWNRQKSMIVKIMLTILSIGCLTYLLTL